MLSGFGEIAKYGSGISEEIHHLVAGNERCIQNAVEAGRIDVIDEHLLNQLIWASIESKCAIVSSDEKEGGRRKVLNLGHTAGHALEAFSPGLVSHGEAVAIGLCFAMMVSIRLGLGDIDFLIGQKERLELLFDCSAKIQLISLKTLPPFLATDKKQSGRGLTWVLPFSVSETVFQRGIDADILRSVWEEFQEV